MLQVFPDLQPLFDLEEEWDRGLIKLSDAARRAVARAVVEEPIEAINTRHYKDRTALLTSMTKGWVEISVPGGAIGEIGAYTYYASYVNDGTRPHEIWGNPLLTFKIGGRWVSTPMVNHHGTQPDGFMSRAYFKAEAVMIREIEIGVADLEHFLEG